MYSILKNSPDKMLDLNLPKKQILNIKMRLKKQSFNEKTNTYVE